MPLFRNTQGQKDDGMIVNEMIQEPLFWDRSFEEPKSPKEMKLSIITPQLTEKQ